MSSSYNEITIKVEVISNPINSKEETIESNINKPVFFLCDEAMNAKSFVQPGDNSVEEIGSFNELNSENCDMYIDNIKTSFKKSHIFDKEGIYTIRYILKKKLNTLKKMFFGCRYITYIDLSKLNTEEVIDMSLMCLMCSRLENINLDNFKTSKVTNMEGMFEGCQNLKSLNLSSFDTSNVEKMTGMFLMCFSLSELNLDNFNTEKVIDMNSIFTSIGTEYLDLSSFSSRSLIIMNYMFKKSFNLKHIKFSKKFEPNNIKYMIGAFSNCDNLEKIECSQDLYDKFVEEQSSIYTLKKLKFISIDEPKPKMTEFKSQYHEHILKKSLINDITQCEACSLAYKGKKMFGCKECDFYMCSICVYMENKKGYIGLKGYLHEHEMLLRGNNKEVHCHCCKEIISINKGYYCELCDIAYCKKCTSIILSLAINLVKYEDL